jgi:hypothetical protein
LRDELLCGEGGGSGYKKGKAREEEGKEMCRREKDLGREKGCLEERVVTKAVYSGSAGKKRSRRNRRKKVKRWRREEEEERNGIVRKVRLI